MRRRTPYTQRTFLIGLIALTMGSLFAADAQATRPHAPGTGAAANAGLPPAQQHSATSSTSAAAPPTAAPVAGGSASGGAAKPASIIRPKPTPAGVQIPDGVRGIVQFTGPPQVNNPAVIGGMIVLDWASVEPSPGIYNWSAIDSGLALWAAHGKRAAIRVSTSALGRSASPDWLYTAGVPSVIWPDGSRLPVYWNAVYLASWQQFINAAAARYDNDPRVLWFQAAVGEYAETKPDQPHGGVSPVAVWQAHGYTDQMWFATLQQIVGFARSAFHHAQLVVAVDSTFLLRTSGYTMWRVMDWLASQRIWSQDDGLTSASSYASSSWRAAHVAEQLAPVARSGDNLAAQIRVAIRGGARYVLVYGSDIVNKSNQAALNEAGAPPA